VSALPGAQVSLVVTTGGGHAAPRITKKLQAGLRGQWRATLAVDKHIAPGAYTLTIRAAFGQQHNQLVLVLHVKAQAKK
jgi:hypothetical protein